MVISRISTLGEILRPWYVKVIGGGAAALGFYDVCCNQFGWPKIPALWGMTGSLFPWWGWLLILQAVFVCALFEYVRRNVDRRSSTVLPESELGPVADRDPKNIIGPSREAKLTLARRSQIDSALAEIEEFIRDEYDALLRSWDFDWQGIMERDGKLSVQMHVQPFGSAIDALTAKLSPLFDRHCAELDVAEIDIQPLIRKTQALHAAVAECTGFLGRVPVSLRDTLLIKPSMRAVTRAVGETHTMSQMLLNDIRGARSKLLGGSNARDQLSQRKRSQSPRPLSASTSPVASAEVEKQPRPILEGLQKERAVAAFMAVRDFLSSRVDPLVLEGRTLASWRKLVERQQLAPAIIRLLAFRGEKDVVATDIGALQRSHRVELDMFGISMLDLIARIERLHDPIQKLYASVSIIPADAATPALMEAFKAQADALNLTVYELGAGADNLRAQIEGVLLHLSRGEGA